MSRKKQLWGVLGTVFLGVLLPVFTFTVAAPPMTKVDFKTLTDGEEIFLAACVTCHGVNGKGAASSMVGFEVLLPDFSDCRFSSREPAADWAAVVREGGPARVFDRIMPAFGEALTGAQIDSAVSHVKGFCKEDGWPQGELNLPRALNTTKAFPEDEVVIDFSSTFEKPVAMAARLYVEKRIGKRHQIEAVLPFGWQQIEKTGAADGATVDYRWGGGISDIKLAWKSVLWHNFKAGTIGSLAAEVIFPTGDESDDLSGRALAFEPFLAVGQVLPKIGFLQFQGGAVISTQPENLNHRAFWRGVYGYTFTQGISGRAWSPMVEVLGQTILESGASPDWTIVPQFQVTLSRRQHVRLGLGARIPLNDFSGRPIAGMIYLLWDWFDGGLFEGWRGA